MTKHQEMKNYLDEILRKSIITDLTDSWNGRNCVIVIKLRRFKNVRKV